MAITTLLDADFVQHLYKVYEGMLNNPAYSKPPVDMASFKAAIDAYAASVTAALDGGKAAITLGDKRRADVALMYYQLGHYVEAACNNEMNTFVSSGFIPAPKPQRGPDQPVAVPVIGAVNQGSTGQAVVAIKKVNKARYYNIRYAPAAPVAAGGSVPWSIISVANVVPPTAINDLTPGTTYTFQARAFGKLGYSDWSATVSRMMI